MKNKSIIISPILGLFFGFFFFAYYHDWVIFRSPFSKQFQQVATVPVEKKKVRLHYWHHEKWNSEEIEILWSHDKGETLYHLLSGWLRLLDEEKAMPKKVSLQSVLLASGEQEAFVSFDRNPFNKEGSAFGKFMLVEGLLKTIRENGIHLQVIQFLTHHKPLSDFHLDFSNPWPVIGFS